MTEQEWLVSDDPTAMLVWVTTGQTSTGWRHVSDRKLRLFACAAYRLPPLADVPDRVIAAAETMADGGTAETPDGVDGLWVVTRPIGSEAAHMTVIDPHFAGRGSELACLLRDIVGSPWQLHIIEDDNEAACWNHQNTTAQEGHAESLDQSGRPWCVENEGGVGMGTGRWPSSAGWIPNTPHQRQQSRRSSEQFGVDNSGSAPAISCGQAERETVGQDVPSVNPSVRSVQSRISGEEAKPQGFVFGVPKSKQERFASSSVHSHREITIKRSWLTPDVLAVARAACEDRSGRVCLYCAGKKLVYSQTVGGYKSCKDCHGTGRIADGRLDPVRLSVLADALEDAGCPGQEECRECHGRGGEFVDSGGFTPWGEPVDSYYMCDGCQGTGRVSHPLIEHLRSSGPHYRGMWSLDLILGKS